MKRQRIDRRVRVMERLPPNTPIAVYGLVDPRSGIVAYIGACRLDRLIYRLRHHLATARSNRNKWPKSEWITSLLDAGLRPQLSLIECTIAEKCKAREIFWIHWFRECGIALTNIRDGGDGVCGWKAGETTTAKKRLYRPTDETVESIRNTLRGKPLAIETRKKISAAMSKGINAVRAKKRLRDSAYGISHETRNKMAEAHTGLCPSDETRDKMKQTAEKLKANGGFASKFRGVQKNKGRRPWRAVVNIGPQQYKTLGTFITEEEAAEAVRLFYLNQASTKESA